MTSLKWACENENIYDFGSPQFHLQSDWIVDGQGTQSTCLPYFAPFELYNWCVHYLICNKNHTSKHEANYKGRLIWRNVSYVYEKWALKADSLVS